MAIVNLTPHMIVLVSDEDIVTHRFEPSGVTARCAVVSTAAGAHDGAPLATARYGAVVGLPDPVKGTIFVVSALVRAAVPSRVDVASPGDLARDAVGVVVGCRSLIVNAGAA